jgi:hypothetical protein
VLSAGIVNILLISVVCAAIAASIYGFRSRTESAIRVLMLLVSPLLFWTLIQAFVLPIAVPRQPRSIPASPVKESKGGARFVLILFDELDQVKTFSERPTRLRLEHFDALRNQAISAENAYSPATDTLLTVPSYLLGRRVSHADLKGFNEVAVTDADTGEIFDVAARPNLFSEAASAGSRIAVVGWHIPYCRIFPGPTYCSWFGNWWAAGPPSIGTLMFYEFGNAIEDLPFAERLGLLNSFDARKLTENRAKHLASYEHILTDAKSRVANPNFDFVYLHFPVPHPPVIFDRSTGTWSNKASTDYFSNVVLADQTMGELQSLLVKAGMWDTTNVLVVGDHGLRAPGGADVRRVPFLLKLAGQRGRLDFSDEFDTVILHDLALLMLRRERLTPDETLHWLRQHVRRPSPPPGLQKISNPGDIIKCHDCA